MLLLGGMPAAFVAPGPPAWSPAFLSSGPGDQLRVLGVQRQGTPCQALVHRQGACQAPLGLRPRDVKRHAVVLACDRKGEEEEEETTLEVVQAALRAVVSVIFVLSCADTCVPGPPYCTHGLRVPASCAPYVPEARGSFPPNPHAQYVLITRASLGRAVRTRAVRTCVPRTVAPQVLFNGVVRVATAVFGATLLLNACGFGHRWVPEPPFVEVRPNPDPNPDPTNTQP